MVGFDDARVGPLKEIARRVFSVVGAIAILAVLDLLPEKIAEIAVGVGVVALLAAAVAPLRLLPQPGGERSAKQSAT